ncbi:hypothetical protein BX661DRAFT_185873 [Kickxella alabastrina]|uniref:uncharacterized protein n=1 Tax=Kickxella alabastrina TaxID=61397 RepID=UPI00222043A8|nr:uncharacterized protein BX661DRAFT_185873 [Kickxella alabastrina]KAI7824286.1 hypothetical protein BX661DRAFT_185873 [Kickxella alabastrina]
MSTFSCCCCCCWMMSVTLAAAALPDTAALSPLPLSLPLPLPLRSLISSCSIVSSSVVSFSIDSLFLWLSWFALRLSSASRRASR